MTNASMTFMGAFCTLPMEYNIIEMLKITKVMINTTERKMPHVFKSVWSNLVSFSKLSDKT